MASGLTLKTFTSHRNKPIPMIQITLTSFSEGENGEVLTSAGTVKIDGEEENPKQVIFHSSMFKSFIIRNLLVLSFGQFLLFMAVDSLSNLQSTINVTGDFGAVSLAVMFGVLAISAFFLPTVIIKSFGCRKTLVFTSISICPYVLVNFSATSLTLIPAAAVCGLALGPLLSARCVFLNQISRKYAKLQNFPVETVNAWFFSIFTTFQQNTEIWGSILSFYALKIVVHNDSYQPNNVHTTCGPDFCYDETSTSHTNFHLRSESRRYILITIFSALALIASFVTAFFLEPLEAVEKEEEAQEQTISLRDFLATFHHFKKLDQILLIPLSLYTGLVNGFYNSDYRKAYIACAWDIPHTGAVSICYGVVSVLVDSACGPCVQVLGRGTLFFLAAVSHFSMILALILWTPDNQHTTGFFLIASTHGIGNGVWMSQIVALYGVLFQKNEAAAFSCFYFLHSLGHLLAFSYSSYLCTNIKLFILMAALVIGLVFYLAVEVRIVKKSLLDYGFRP